VEKQVRSRLREQFDTTLPRFDLMAQLERAPDGLRMNELSRRMMVTGGNVTGITDQLVAEGLVERIDVAGDRRAYRVRLTPKGPASSPTWRAPTRGGSSRPLPVWTTRNHTLHRLLGKVKSRFQEERMKHYIGPTNPMRAQFEPRAGYQARHFAWSCEDGVGTVTLNRPERKNPLTFDSYAELRDLFQALKFANDVKVVVVTGAGGNFCSGGDVHEIIGPLTKMTMPELLEFTRMTGDLVKTMRNCPQPIIGAIDGICAGAGAMMALACDLRYGTPATRTAFLFTRVGLAGADMGACALLPRVIGQGRASELLFTGRAMTAHRGPGLGLLQRAARQRRPAGGASMARRAGRRPHLRPRHDQDHAAAGMGHDHRAGDRGRGTGPGHLHADAGLPPRLRGVRGETEARLRRRLTWPAPTQRAPAGHLALPFFDEAHRQLADGLRDWTPAAGRRRSGRPRRLPRLGAPPGRRRLAALLRAAEHGGALPALDSRALVVLRETLAFHSPLADFAFAMQGLGSGAISLAGTPAQQAAYLPAVARGEKIAAFALSEPDAGSDVALCKQ
jgi:enoyl-CoA hydratase/carnithine racemase